MDPAKKSAAITRRIMADTLSCEKLTPAQNAEPNTPKIPTKIPEIRVRRITLHSKVRERTVSNE
jgi:hypothetical protein